jgi:thioesterase domain-containing protein
MLASDVPRPWPTAGEAMPLDHGGPVDVPFEPFGSAWIERPLVARFEQIDEPLLARFRAAFDGDARFSVVDYPGWRETIDSGASFDTIVDAVVAQITAQNVDEHYRLAGYSFGGSVAYEVACRLAAAGRRVGFIGLLDSRRVDMAQPDQLRRYARLLAAPRRISVVMLRSTLMLLVRRRWFATLRAAGGLMLARPTTAAYGFHRHLIEMLRADALRRWRPRPLHAPMTLFLSDEHLRGAPADYGWSDLCTPLSVVHIGGTHATMLEPPLQALLCARLLDAIRAAGSPPAP